MDKRTRRLHSASNNRGSRRVNKHNKTDFGDLILLPVEWVVLGMTIMTVLMNWK